MKFFGGYEDDIKMDLRETGFQAMAKIPLNQYYSAMMTFVDTIMNVRLHKGGKFVQ
jgi:hypothetical protein